MLCCWSTEAREGIKRESFFLSFLESVCDSVSGSKFFQHLKYDLLHVLGAWQKMEFYHTTCGFAIMPQRGPIPQDCATLAVYLYFSVSVFELFLVLQFDVSFSKWLVSVLRMFCTTTPCFKDRSSHIQVSFFQHRSLYAKKTSGPSLIQHFTAMIRSSDCTRLLRLPALQCVVLQQLDSTDTGDERRAFPMGPGSCRCHRASVLDTAQMTSHNSCVGVTTDPGSAKPNLKPICHK